MATVLLKPDHVYNVGKIVCVGQNYMKHIEELNSVKSKNPLLFFKPSTSILHEGNSVVLPDFSNDVHHETELALLIGEKASKINPDEWYDYVCGVGIALDLTLRDIQREAKQNGHPWAVCKGFDGSCPISNFIPIGQIDDIQNIEIELYVNQSIRQKGNTKNMIWTVGELLSYISKIFTLEPGDVVLTGTPEGVAPLKSGDKLQANLANLVTIQFDVS